MEMARRNLTVEGCDVAAFLAHQVVEKLLKAAFALEGRPVPIAAAKIAIAESVLAYFEQRWGTP